MLEENSKAEGKQRGSRTDLGPCCVTLGGLLRLSEPQFLCLPNDCIITTHVTYFPRRGGRGNVGREEFDTGRKKASRSSKAFCTVTVEEVQRQPQVPPDQLGISEGSHLHQGPPTGRWKLCLARRAQTLPELIYTPPESSEI